jgi:amino acid adenylation domain-containing protein
LERTLALPVALLGVMKSGAAYVPLDAGQAAERLGRIVADAGIDVILVEGAAPLSLAGVDTIYLDGAGSDADWLAEYPSTAPDVEVAGTDSAYVLYTSGSTGEPKGVDVPHAALLDYCAFAREGYYADALAGSLVATSFAFDLTVPSLYVPLLVGGCVELMPPGEELPALARRLDGADAPASLLRLTPSHLQGLLPLVDATPRSTAHVFVIGGEAFPVALAKAVQAKFPAARLINHYGPTETVVGCAWYDVSANLADLERTIPIGRPMSNTRLSVRGAAGELLPPGVAGELYIGGAGVTRGYVNRAGLTAQVFVADPAEPGARMYRSGDRVRWRADGTLEFLGRMDGQVKLRGFRIEPGEIEAVLREEAGEAVVGVRGEGSDARLVAWLVGDDDDAWLSHVRTRVAARLPAYMHPSSYVVMDTLPLSSNGKVDRRKLPDPGSPDATSAWIAPSGATEERLARLWADALGLERVSATAGFFEMGGHSLLAMRLINAVQSEWHVELPLRTLFEASDIRSIARVVDEQMIRRDNFAQAMENTMHVEREW